MKDVIFKIALIGILLACAVSLRGQFVATRSSINIERSRAHISDRLPLTSIGGIDASGQLVDMTSPTRAKRFVVCGFRNSTLQQDIDVWTAVATRLAAHPDVRIVGYCDGDSCAQTVKKTRPQLPFTMIAHGEVVTSQALLSADARGDCVLLNDKMRAIRRVSWRMPERSPVDLAKDILE